MRCLPFAAALLLGLLLPVVESQAQSSCSALQAQCAARCKQRNPGDVNCVSDHCTPKLNECRATGCWQEGQRYGGQLTCNLKRS
jgi:hypothetical protein